MDEKDKEIEILKAAVKAQAKLLMHYRIGISAVPDWVFDNIDVAKNYYKTDNLQKI